MNILHITLIVALALVPLAPALADDVASERTRLANQRIQVEEERRAREEAERLSREAGERSTPDEGASARAIPDGKDVVREVSAERMAVSRALEQLRELGALRDAGYVTEQEFEQLKKKILDATL
ncbi:MAG: SHOCT domain-containing protein [Woeseiaceae bacterium]|nr:SHOCT domain-containing protein [Woeseiaceae bacterium]